MTTEKDLNVTEELTEKPQAIQAGDMLRSKREKLGISQEEIADRLRLRLSIIQSIDNNNYEFDQVATFTRGYLRSYAKAVQLDEKEVLASLNDLKEAQHSEQKMQSFSRQTKKAKHDSRIMKLTWIIFVIIVGISSVWWYQNQQDTLTEMSQSDSTDNAELIVEENTPTLDLNSNTNEPASPDRSQFESITPALDADNTHMQDDSVVPTQDQSSLETEQSDINIADSQQVNSVETDMVTTEEVSEPVENNDNALFLSFSSDCWVEIKDVAGKTLATGVKKAGSTINLAGQAPYKIILGAPEGVSMTFENEPVDLSEYNTGRVAKFTLPRS
ncbi:cytoskeleton protein RodZ [Vibrio sp. TH_r3]|uniref:cytoskeleton protein RodZ n=1 Tax=Vibrio sp. TH_r3 TaxID=3082084 RepID=UPI0029533BE6|nr:cytoskeleton protein RodZ [Vibrio sp. TH_r3]MDV7105296.1 cytoskeleton protein RodZ [Vibrio sp. TH_r3]